MNFLDCLERKITVSALPRFFFIVVQLKKIILEHVVTWVVRCLLVLCCLEHGFEPKYSIPQSSGFPCSEKWSLFVIILLDRRNLLKLCRLQQPPYFSTTKKITKTETPNRTASSPAALLLQENQKLFVVKYRYPGFLSIVIVMIKCGLVTFNTRLLVTPAPAPFLFSFKLTIFSSFFCVGSNPFPLSIWRNWGSLALSLNEESKPYGRNLHGKETAHEIDDQLGIRQVESSHQFLQPFFCS